MIYKYILNFSNGTTIFFTASPLGKVIPLKSDFNHAHSGFLNSRSLSVLYYYTYYTFPISTTELLLLLLLVNAQHLVKRQF